MCSDRKIRFARAAIPRAARAFTLAEVMVASAVLMLGASGALVTLQRSLSAISHARQLDAVSSVLQDELERLRTRSWGELEELQKSPDQRVDLPPGGDYRNYACVRSIRDIREGMKEIAVEASWGGADGRARTARLVTRYSRSGLNDYFYTTR